MRRYLFVFAFFQLAILKFCGAQNVPNGDTQPASKTAKKTPSYVPGASTKYVRTFIPQIPITDSSLVNLNATIESVQVSTQYFDGMGRSLESVVKQASPAKKDFIAPVSFDDYGNVSTQYLPYVATTGSNNNTGKYKTSPFVADSTYYSALFPDDQISYGKVLFDASPLNQVTKQMAPGNSWAGTNKGISYIERANTVSDSVRIWSINITNEDDIPTSTAAYAPGSLLVKDITDERADETISYTDELGRTVFTKTQLSGSPSTGHTGWLCTYYVYDEMNHLRMVISPKATSFLLSNSWDLAGNTDVVDNLCYSYWYDNRGRVTEKHIPSKGKTYIAYDLLDRVVMTQDENLRTTSQWAFIKYDAESRPSKAGLITLSGTNKDTVINQAARSADYPILSGTYSILTETYYDDYSWTTGTPLDGNLNTSNINSANFITTYNASPDYAQSLTQSSRIRGSVTGGKKLIIGTTTYLYTAVIYDEDGRAIQTKQTNIAGQTDVLTSEHDFAGKVLRTYIYNKESASGAAHTLLTKYTYDHVGRLKTIVKNIDSSHDKTTSTLTYNELGQVITKKFGSNLAFQDYTYNIRGWLTGINKDFVETAGDSGDYFGEALFYDYGFSTTILNGNIAGVKWKSTGDDIQRAYGFTYDKPNRLITADFTQQNEGSTSWTKDKMDFSVSGLKYDPNGNITFMNQRGVNVNTPTLIDSLKYTYFDNSNQLQKVKDFITTTPDMGDFQDTTLGSNDYAYDNNGNQLKDNNKHIHTTGGGNGIAYNFLDKPDSITANSKGAIVYTYDASGALLKKVIRDNNLGQLTIITYTMGFVYQRRVPVSGTQSTTDTVQYALHEEGKIRWSYTQAHPNGKFVYDYFLKDHLNNIRSVVTDENDTSFYPVASLESATIANEKIYYTGLDSGVVLRSSVTNYPSNDTYTSPNDYVQKLRGDGVKIGAGILLKVMAGDTINVHADSWYRLNGLTPGTPVSPLDAIVTALTNSLPGVSGNKYIASQLGSTVLDPSVTSFLNTRDATGNTAHPNSWLNIIVLDEQMNPVITNDGNNSYFAQVGSSNTSSVVSYNPSRAITKSGYVYIYVSNETPNIYTYWDNLQVTHLHGHLLQEEGYYPFGLEMKAISSSAALKPQTNYKFNGGTELNDNFDINYYETYFRNYDPQIGRFTGIDALAEQSFTQSPYQFAINDPIFFNDQWGLKENQPDYSNFWDNILSTLWDSPYGGTFTTSGGGGGGNYAFFQSDVQVFGQGAGILTETGGWGQGGAVGSYDIARQNYINKFHDDPGPAPIIIKSHNEWDVYGNVTVVPNDWKDVEAQLARNGFGPGDLDNFWSNWSWAARMTAEWAFWLGPQQRTFNNDAVARALMNSRIVGEARNYWYNEVNAGRKSITDGVTNFAGEHRVGGGNFGFTGLTHAGLDPIEQFMGSTNQFTINSDGKTLTYTITNTTSFQSLMYGLTPSFLNFYNTTQTYIFTEPINLNRVHP